ncbi:hypothetical protein CBP31_13025 [Oceanisphaera profunda]|uniref:DUF1232 domain-containing protein n=1 Tax=Oceanisphaera profunda TaxID=1416627 RepID=A0A1Y0D7B7_9GAMM|nr:YkvA family protein [Oceanisphaera profunda]ART83429.1 hypothetical protein CBP31_13025 [Oceanisphaera profunda]
MTHSRSSNSSQDHQEHYSEGAFWNKAKKLGRKVLMPALKLYYAAQDSDTPAWAKAIIYSALGYLILPVDAIPDVLLGVGYVDDFGVLLGALGVVAAHIKDKHEQLAAAALNRWLGK